MAILETVYNDKPYSAATTSDEIYPIPNHVIIHKLIHHC